MEKHTFFVVVLMDMHLGVMIISGQSSKTFETGAQKGYQIYM